jgi:pantoate--beta-alanine ligase
MRTLCSIEQVRSALVGARRDGRKIGLVPTMGAFHDGHLSLMRRAREDCDVVVVSLFVNPAQFNDQRDLGSYPRDEQRDAALAEQIGVDYLFMPSIEEIYPPGFATTVSVAGLTETLEGTHRGRAHFDAVTTVVAKLLNIVGPDVAYFGRKDAQQAIVVQRMVRDLDIPVRIELCPTVREPDGLAMSSRNVRLSGRDRARAGALHRALDALAQSIAAGERDPVVARGRALAQLAADGLEPDYLELVSADTLTPLERIDGHPILALIAARVGDTRLIDNELIQPLPSAEAAGATKPHPTAEAAGATKPLPTAQAAGATNDGSP